MLAMGQRASPPHFLVYSGVVTSVGKRKMCSTCKCSSQGWGMGVEAANQACNRGLPGRKERKKGRVRILGGRATERKTRCTMLCLISVDLPQWGGEASQSHPFLQMPPHFRMKPPPRSEELSGEKPTLSKPQLSWMLNHADGSTTLGVRTMEGGGVSKKNQEGATMLQWKLPPPPLLVVAAIDPLQNPLDWLSSEFKLTVFGVFFLMK